MRSPKKPPLFATRAIHAGQPPDPATGAVITPIYATSTYAQESPGKHKGLDYGRSHNPTRYAYERCVADLEAASTASRSPRAWRRPARCSSFWIRARTS